MAICNENGTLYDHAKKLELYSIIGVSEAFRLWEVIDSKPCFRKDKSAVTVQDRLQAEVPLEGESEGRNMAIGMVEIMQLG